MSVANVLKVRSDERYLEEDEWTVFGKINPASRLIAFKIFVKMLAMTFIANINHQKWKGDLFELPK